MNSQKSFEEFIENAHKLINDPNLNKLLTNWEFRVGQLALLKCNLKPIYKLTFVLMVERVRRNRVNRLEREIEKAEETNTIGFGSEENSEPQSFTEKQVLGFRA